MKSNKIKPNSINSLLVISIASLSLILSIFFQLFFGIATWGSEIKSQMKIYVYLDDSLQVTQINSVINDFKKLSFVETINNKKQLSFVSKDKVAKEFLKTSNDHYEDLLGENNPFKNLIMLGIKDELKNSANFNLITTKLSKYPGVYEVDFPLNYISILLVKIKQIGFLMIILMLILTGIIYIQMSNYIKLNIHNNRVLIKSMQLLGSTHAFIRNPYLKNSAVHGLLGACIGYVLAILIVFYFSNQLPEVSNVLTNNSNQFISLVGCISICTLFSLFSTYLTLNKYLRIQHNNLF